MLPSTLDPADMPAELVDSRLSDSFTFHFDKYSCLKGAWYAHVVMAYIVAFSGLACFITRVWNRLYPLHVWFGRLYIISMLWATATSLLIHNTGLPTATLVSFVWVLGGLCIGWVIINIHQVLMGRAAVQAAQESIKRAGGTIPGGDLGGLIAAEKGRIAGSKTFVQRFFSWKAAHGAIMFVSWFNIVGRIFASNQTGDFTCYTYPYYKQIDTPEFLGAGKPLTPVPVHDPRYSRLPWAKMGSVGWGAALLFGPLLGALIVGAAYSAVASKKARRSAEAAAAAARGDDSLEGKP